MTTRTPKELADKNWERIARAFGWDRLSNDEICMLCAGLLHYYARRLPR